MTATASRNCTILVYQHFASTGGHSITDWVNFQDLLLRELGLEKSGSALHHDEDYPSGQDHTLIL